MTLDVRRRVEVPARPPAALQRSTSHSVHTGLSAIKPNRSKRSVDRASDTARGTHRMPAAFREAGGVGPAWSKTTAGKVVPEYRITRGNYDYRGQFKDTVFQITSPNVWNMEKVQ